MKQSLFIFLKNFLIGMLVNLLLIAVLNLNDSGVVIAAATAFITSSLISLAEVFRLRTLA